MINRHIESAQPKNIGHCDRKNGRQQDGLGMDAKIDGRIHRGQNDESKEHGLYRWRDLPSAPEQSKSNTNRDLRPERKKGSVFSKKRDVVHLRNSCTARKY